MARELGHVLISGANGHLGRRLAARLAEEPGCSGVRALVRSNAAAAAVQALPPAVRPEIRIVDYADGPGLAKALDGAAHLVHLVGILKETATAKYAQAHETVSTALSRAAAAAGVRSAVYLSILGADAGSRNPCLRSKANAEAILLRAAVPTTVLRVPMVLGPGDMASQALRAQATAGLLPLVRGGATLEQPIDADDLAEAIVRVLRRDDLDDQVLELAGPECVSHRELVLRSAALWGTRPRILPLPIGLARLVARILGRVLARPPFTLAMLEVLEHDDRVEVGPVTRRLGIELTPLGDTLARCVGPEAPES